MQVQRAALWCIDLEALSMKWQTATQPFWWCYQKGKEKQTHCKLLQGISIRQDIYILVNISLFIDWWWSQASLLSKLCWCLTPLSKACYEPKHRWILQEWMTQITVILKALYIDLQTQLRAVKIFCSTHVHNKEMWIDTVRKNLCTSQKKSPAISKASTLTRSLADRWGM